MDRAYTICMVVGIVIPLCSLVLGTFLEFLDGLFDGIFSFFDGLDLDIDFSIDIGGTDICFLPISLQSLCAGSLLFGTVGKIVFNGSNYATANVAAGISAYIAAIAVQTLIKKLKKVKHHPPAKKELLYCDAKVTNTIISGGYGAISIKKEDGVTLNYPAKAENGELMIKQETPVYILRFEKNVAIVKEVQNSNEIPQLYERDE